MRCRYLHSEIETLERVRILRDLRRGEFDVLIGINLLREGLDLPEVSLVAILDADKEGYLRSATSLIQTMGRCARHLEGRAILYADRMTDSMRQAIGETNRRRAKQQAYNAENNITPQSIVKSVDMQLAAIVEADYVTVPADDSAIGDISNEEQLLQAIAQLEAQMREAAKNFEFERAAALRDRIRSLKQRDLGVISATELPLLKPVEREPDAATAAAASSRTRGRRVTETSSRSRRSRCHPRRRATRAESLVSTLLAQLASHHSAFQFLERIKRSAPHDSALPQRDDRRPRQHPDKNQRADGIRQRVKRRDSEFAAHAAHRDDRQRDGDQIEHARPAVRERQRGNRKQEHEHQAEDLQRDNCQRGSRWSRRNSSWCRESCCLTPGVPVHAHGVAGPRHAGRTPASFASFPSFMSSTTSMASRRCVPIFS